jgi:hypothetical protein
MLDKLGNLTPIANEETVLVKDHSFQASKLAGLSQLPVLKCTQAL